MELLAKKVLNDPVEIQIGGRSVVNPDVDQQIEVITITVKVVSLLHIK